MQVHSTSSPHHNTRVHFGVNYPMSSNHLASTTLPLSLVGQMVVAMNFVKLHNVIIIYWLSVDQQAMRFTAVC